MLAVSLIYSFSLMTFHKRDTIRIRFVSYLSSLDNGLIYTCRSKRNTYFFEL